MSIMRMTPNPADSQESSADGPEGMGTIFIQLASYRDPQLVPTLESCIDNASSPKKLHFGICRQYSDDDKFDIIPSALKSRCRFSINDVPHKDSKGVCWARNNVQKMYAGEQYTLQIDSHHRFEKNWDKTLIKMIKDLQEVGYAKPLLTAYASSFDPADDPDGRSDTPWEMVWDRFIPEGAVFFLPSTIEGWKDRSFPKRARFYSAHFCFTLGKFCQEVPHDPEYYFHGEEISIAARAFTHGYDLFHPHKIIIFHEYTRKGRTKCWDDDPKWGERNAKCHKRNRILFGMDGEDQSQIDFGKFGFGTERSLRDYEKYAGICFGKRAITEDALSNKEPSYRFNISDEEWEKSLISRFKHCIDVHKDSFPLSDYDFICVTFEDADGEEMFRLDENEGQIKSHFENDDDFIKFWREFDCPRPPKSWKVWPHSKSEGWCDEIRGQL